MINDRSNNPSPLNIPEEDLRRCHDLLGLASWYLLAGKRVFITGGTGFIGKWLLATLLDADKELGLNCYVTVLSRDPSAFQRDWPDIVGRVEWITGDVRSFSVDTHHFDVIIHAATDVVAHATPENIFSTCVDGTRRVMLLARQCKSSLLLLVSSGAVYGPLPAGMTHVPEIHLGGPDPLLSSSAYGEGKRASEWLASHTANNGLEVKIARVFSLVGPHLPLDKHFAVGNFLNAVIGGTDIVLSSDGTAYRSYLYAADMAAWLWAVLLRGKPGRAYNVGSEDALSILALAHRVTAVLQAPISVRAARLAPVDHVPQYYVPQTRRSILELNLGTPLGLDEALLRTARWHGYVPHSDNA